MLAAAMAPSIGRQPIVAAMLNTTATGITMASRLLDALVSSVCASMQAAAIATAASAARPSDRRHPRGAVTGFGAGGGRGHERCDRRRLDGFPLGSDWRSGVRLLGATSQLAHEPLHLIGQGLEA